MARLRYTFRSTVRSGRTGRVYGGGPVTVEANDEETARTLARNAECDSFGAPMATVDLAIVRVEQAPTTDEEGTR